MYLSNKTKFPKCRWKNKYKRGGSKRTREEVDNMLDDQIIQMEKLKVDVNGVLEQSTDGFRKMGLEEEDIDEMNEKIDELEGDDRDIFDEQLERMQEDINRYANSISLPGDFSELLGQHVKHTSETVNNAHLIGGNPYIVR